MLSEDVIRKCLTCGDHYKASDDGGEIVSLIIPGLDEAVITFICTICQKRYRGKLNIAENPYAEVEK